MCRFKGVVNSVSISDEHTAAQSLSLILQVFSSATLAFRLLSGCYEMRRLTQINSVVTTGPKFSRNAAPVRLQLELATRKRKGGR